MIGRWRTRLVLAVLATLIAWGWLLWDATSRQAAQTAGLEAMEAAREAIPAILGYQPATAEKDLPAAAQARLTGRFLDEYNQLITTVVVPDAKQRALSASAKVPAVAVVSADRDQVVVLAYVDQTLKAGSAAPTQANTRVRVTLDKIDGRWLISAFDDI